MFHSLLSSSSKNEPVPGKAEHLTTQQDGQIYRIPLLAFPGLWGNAYLVLVDDYRVLIDTGSGFGDSNQQLEDGLHSASQQAGIDLTLPSLTHILITHGHIDHFGGLSYVRQRTSASLGIHELDRRVVTNHAERLAIVARHLDEYLIEGGVSSQSRVTILEMYKITKSLYQSVPVDFTFEAIGMHLGPFEMLHVPGHCPGHVVIRLHDVLFSGDHVLEAISPHQAPESLTHFTGLGHYLESLETLRPWAKQVRLTLPGHQSPITQLDHRLDEIHRLHEQRLEKVLECMAEPHTIGEVSKKLFGEVNGYNILLAIEETGAHVEYLYQRGMLGIDNLVEIEASRDLIPIRYRCL